MKTNNTFKPLLLSFICVMSICSCTKVEDKADKTTSAELPALADTQAQTEADTGTESSAAEETAAETQPETTETEEQSEQETEAPKEDHTAEMIAAVDADTALWFDPLSADDNGIGLSFCSMCDIDLDGTPELIVGGKTYGEHGAVNFKIYGYDGSSGLTERADLMFYPENNYRYECGIMPAYLLRERSSGEPKLIAAEIDGTAFEQTYALKEFDLSAQPSESSSIASLTVYYEDSGEETDPAAEANFKEACRNVFNSDKYEIFSLTDICTPLYCANTAQEYLDEADSVPPGMDIYRAGEDNSDKLKASYDSFLLGIKAHTEASAYPFDDLLNNDT